MELGTGTDTTRGLVWAERFLDNSWRNSALSFSANAPVTVNNETQKIIILLTDGRIATFDTDNDGAVDPRAARDSNRASVLNGFTSQCGALEQVANLDVYTIAFGIDDDDFETMLRDCASGNGRYLEADVENLDNVLQGVTTNIAPIRLSR